MKLKQLVNIILISLLYYQCSGQETHQNNKKDIKIVEIQAANELPVIVGAERTNLYLKELQGKKVGIVANHTSMIKHSNIVDSLLSLKINIIRVFSPEHGFRGTEIGRASCRERV